jgi:ubiquinone/menaquinone biosynthesis C-methylase UbiE
LKPKRFANQYWNCSAREAVTITKHYDELIIKESRHWGEVRQDPQNPQIWHDPGLFEIFFGKEYRHFLDCAIANGPRILELGCGEGNLTLNLASHGLDLTAIDLSADRIERARSRAGKLNLAIQPNWIVADLNTFPLPRNGFDSVVAHDALHHILHLDRLCDDVKHALKPGGYFIVMDYVGMGLLRKLFAGILYGVLPTYQPYKAKWRLRKRLTGFLATEGQKRKALELSSTEALHEGSPFEEISQQSINDEIKKRFEIVEHQFFCPFWFYLAAKIRVPASWKYPLAKFFRSFDNLISSLHVARGAYVFIVARNTPSTQ